MQAGSSRLLANRHRDGNAVVCGPRIPPPSLPPSISSAARERTPTALCVTDANRRLARRSCPSFPAVSTNGCRDWHRKASSVPTPSSLALDPPSKSSADTAGSRKSNGDVVPLREYLEHVWAAVSHEALTMIFKDADAAGLEPDARLTAMWLWTLSTASSDTITAMVSTEEGAEEDADEDDEEGRSRRRSAASSWSSTPPGRLPRGLASTWKRARASSR